MCRRTVEQLLYYNYGQRRLTCIALLHFFLLLCSSYPLFSIQALNNAPAHYMNNLLTDTETFKRLLKDSTIGCKWNA